MIDILHIYDENDSMAAHYVAMLTTATEGKATMRSATTAATFKLLVEEHGPDIVHVHTQSPFALAPGFRTVVTPNGKPLNTANAYVVIARSQMERDSLSSQCERIETVLNPIITRTTTIEECACQIMAIYQRVMNSSVWMLLEASTRRSLGILLNAAICGDARWIEPESAKMPQTVSPSQFQLLYTYAEREGVLSHVQEGIAILGIAAPDYTPTPGYLPHNFQKPQPLHSPDIVSVLKDVKSNGLSMLRLVETAKALRDDCLDEAQLLTQLGDQRLLSTFQGILQLLTELDMITEGFMPSTPEANSEYQRLKTLLTNRQNVV